MPITVAKRCLNIRLAKKNGSSHCQTKNGLIRIVALKNTSYGSFYQKHRDPLNVDLREKYHIVLTEYKKLLCKSLGGKLASLFPLTSLK